MKTMNHSDYPKQLKSRTEAELRFIVKDAQEAQRVNPSNPNNSFYADEVCYAAAELRARGIK